MLAQEVLARMAYWSSSWSTFQSNAWKSSDPRLAGSYMGHGELGRKGSRAEAGSWVNEGQQRQSMWPAQAECNERRNAEDAEWERVGQRVCCGGAGEADE